MSAEPFTRISVIVPVYNEEENVAELHGRIITALSPLSQQWEILYVDDGSRDRSFDRLKAATTNDRRVKIIRFMRNYGQTAAIAAGIDHAQGEVVVFLDADLQNDPKDIPTLLTKLAEGYDVVSGWRAHRKDAFINRKLPSMIANGIISWVTGCHLHDYGCTLKAYRREFLKGFTLYGEMHRFLPAYAYQNGARIVELPVDHHPRTRGTSKYGIERTFKVVLDLITVKFISTYAHKPSYLFGMVGMALIALAVLLVGYLVTMKLLTGASLIESPLLLMSTMFVILGVQSIFLGLIAELLMRTYHESQDKPTYRIKEAVNLTETE
ncbi:MAG TPA: glycosyltransferase family 2 protein [bacterium]|nr:glycosyltransferase family 2 protein [bacterium]